MRSSPRKKKPASRPIDRAPGETSARPDVDIDTKKQTIRVRDARIINAGQRAFCRRLLEAAARRPGISKAEVDLADACCRIEFSGKNASSQKMADLFADCVQEASGKFANAPTGRFVRKPEEWLKMTAYPLVDDVSLWETMPAKSNGVKLRHHCANEEREMPHMAEAISRLKDVQRCQASLHSRSLTVDFRHSIHELNGFMDQAERSFEQLLADEAKRHEVDLHPGTRGPIGDIEVATGMQRLLYLALAGGAFMLTVVGLIVPGIPTVPFLLATSYFLARSSSWLDEKLRESIFFGSIVTEWERRRALGPQSKAKLMAISGAIVLAAVILSPLSPLGIIALLLVSSLSVYGVYRLPGLEEEPRATVSRMAPRLALPALTERPLSKNPRDRSLKSRDSISPTTSWPFVRTMVERDVVDSTNDVAAELLREGGVALPLAVRAHRQTRGRGRGGHAWWSDEGSLTFTLAIDPAAHGLAQVLEPMVALSTAVAVIDALDELGFGQAAIGIRWPNDLECAGGKLGGILPEAIELNDGRYLSVGVGLNVTTNLGEAPELVKAMATSLGALSASPIEADLTSRLLAAIFRHFESVLSRLVLGDRELRARWNVLDLLRNCPVRVDVGTHVVVGRARGIDADGALCVDDGKETIRLFGGTVLR